MRLQGLQNGAGNTHAPGALYLLSNGEEGMCQNGALHGLQTGALHELREMQKMFLREGPIHDVSPKASANRSRAKYAARCLARRIVAAMQPRRRVIAASTPDREVVLPLTSCDLGVR